jgi:siderophore synthetase component
MNLPSGTLANPDYEIDNIFEDRRVAVRVQLDRKEAEELVKLYSFLGTLECVSEEAFLDTLREAVSEWVKTFPQMK